MNIDLNCDMGEDIRNDEAIMPYISSANIACGYHAGDPASMRETVQLAKRYGVAVGAHPGWRDREGFGRREMTLPIEDVVTIVLEQIRILHAIAKTEGVELNHVKPHGALYNQAAKDQGLANAIARAVKSLSRELVLVGLAGSGLVEAGVKVGLRVANEGFPDRSYNPDGTLVSRREPHALLGSPEEVASHAIQLVRQGTDFNGRRVRVETLCLHGDHPRAAENARAVHDALKEYGVEVAAL
jgi:5-oxoprolinase (ATP-hydrolysing) subunit A